MVNRRRRGSSGKFFSYSEDLKKKQKAAVGAPLDTTLDEKEEKRFRVRYSNLAKRLSKELPLTFEEVESLMVIYYKFQRIDDKIQRAVTRIQFKDLLHNAFDLTDADLVNDVAYVLDKKPSPYISLENWVRAMALFLRGTLEQKIRHCFEVYDIFGTGRIMRDRMLHLMKDAIVGEEDSEDVIKDLLEVVTKKLDVNRDGKITFEDYKQAVSNNPLMIECLGQCLPTRLAAKGFFISFTPYFGKL